MYLHKIHNVSLKLKIHFTLWSRDKCKQKKLSKKNPEYLPCFFTLLLNVFFV